MEDDAYQTFLKVAEEAATTRDFNKFAEYVKNSIENIVKFMKRDDINNKPTLSWLILFSAIYAKFPIDYLRKLIDIGIDIETRMPSNLTNGETIFSFLVRWEGKHWEDKEHEAYVQFFLDNGIALSSKDKAGITPMKYAKSQRFLDMMIEENNKRVRKQAIQQTLEQITTLLSIDRIDNIPNEMIATIIKKI